MDLVMRLPVILILILIVGSLGQGMYYLAKDDGEGDKTQLVRALTVRISLSLLLFFLLMVAYMAGWITPNAVNT